MSLSNAAAASEVFSDAHTDCGNGCSEGLSTNCKEQITLENYLTNIETKTASSNSNPNIKNQLVEESNNVLMFDQSIEINQFVNEFKMEENRNLQKTNKQITFLIVKVVKTNNKDCKKINKGIEDK